MVPAYRWSQSLLYKVLPRNSTLTFFLAQDVLLSSSLLLLLLSCQIGILTQFNLSCRSWTFYSSDWIGWKVTVRRGRHAVVLILAPALLTPLGVTVHDPAVDLGADNDTGLGDDATSLTLGNRGEEQDPDRNPMISPLDAHFEAFTAIPHCGLTMTSNEEIDYSEKLSWPDDEDMDDGVHTNLREVSEETRKLLEDKCTWGVPNDQRLKIRNNLVFQWTLT